MRDSAGLKAIAQNSVKKVQAGVKINHPDFARQASDRSDGGLFLDLGAEVHSWARRGRPRPIRGCYVFQ